MSVIGALAILFVGFSLGFVMGKSFGSYVASRRGMMAIDEIRKLKGKPWPSDEFRR